MRRRNRLPAILLAALTVLPVPPVPLAVRPVPLAVPAVPLAVPAVPLAVPAVPLAAPAAGDAAGSWIAVSRPGAAAPPAAPVRTTAAGPPAVRPAPGPGSRRPTVRRTTARRTTAGPPTAGPPTVRRAPGGAFRWPLDGTPAVVRRFDPPPQPWLAGHRGVDLAGTAGSPVRAAGAGVVVYAGRIAGRGVLSIGHAGGLRTTYEPVEVADGLAPGTAVPAGAVLGVLAAGHPGCPRSACLHWGLRRDRRYLDPLTLLGLGRVRLLPLGGAQRGE